MSSTRNRKPSQQLEGIPRRPDGRRTLGPLESSVTTAAATAAAALALAQMHASRHAAVGADPLSVLALGGFPGGTATFLRADAAFAAPVGAPGGANTQVQFNDAGVLNGDAGLVYDKAADQLTLAGLLDLSGAAAGQIKFPASQNASADANTLDDYEEGLWTPNVGGTATYFVQDGFYTKKGREVSVQAHMFINAIGTGSAFTMSGLPFAVAGTETACFVGYFANLAVSLSSVAGHLTGTTVQFTGVAAPATGVGYPQALFGNNARIYFTGVYIV